MGRECQSAACSNNYNNNGNIVSTLEAESDVPAVAKWARVVSGND